MRARSIAGTLAVLVLALTVLCPKPAQAGDEGSIEGRISDPSGAVIPGALLKARNTRTSAKFDAISSEDGLFQFPVLPVGPYQLRVEHTGFATLIQQGIIVTVGARISLTLTLSLAVRTDAVTVSGTTPLIETTRSKVSSTLGSRSINELPVNGRNFVDFVLLTPGVTRDAQVGDLSFAGQRMMNSLLVDGADDNNPFFNQALGRAGFGRAPFQFSQAAVEEFQVNTNAYSAEFGRAGAGVINTVTKSGSNDLHGTGFWYYRDRGMNANDPVNKLNGAPKSPFHFHQFGGALGGPIVKNKFFFFLSYDGQRSTLPNPVFLNLPAGFTFSSDPAVSGFQQRALAYLVPRAASWNLTLDQNTYFTKFDWQISPIHHLSGRWNRQNFTGDNLENRGPQVSFEHTGATLINNDTVVASLTSTISTSMVNVASFAYLRSDEPSLTNSINPEAKVFEGGQLVLTIGRFPIDPRETNVQGWQWSDTLSLVRGHHSLRVGTDILWDQITFNSAANFSGSYTFTSLASFGRSLAGAPLPLAGESYLQAFSGDGTPGARVHPNSAEFAGFIQDEWRFRPSLTFNLGVRYDVQLLAGPSVRNPSPELAAAGLDTSFIPTDKNNVAPRLGFAWSPLRNSRLVVRGGYGVFYARTPSLMTARPFFQNGITVQTRTFTGGLIPSYPNTLCGLPDPSGTPPSCAAPPAGSGNPIIELFSRKFSQAYTQQGSFGIEVQAADDLAVSASYLVVKGTHLPRTRDINLGTPTNPTHIGIAGTSTVLTYQSFTLPRPIAGFDRILEFESAANSIYHGLAVQVNKRFSHHFELSGSYTLSKVIDDVPDPFAVNPGIDDFRMLSDPSNPRADRAAGINDQRHRLVMSGIWELSYANDLPAIPKAILGGWEVSGILTAQTGQPYSGLINFDLNNDGNSATDRTPGLGRDTFYLPSTVSFDPRVTRNVQLTERTKLQFIWEAFNVFNRFNITGVRTTQFSRSTSALLCGIAIPCLVPQNTGLSAFGTPTTTSGPRIMQLSVKIVF